ncbi:MAG: tyrosine decarboxylase MfnA [Candidatus Thorarchaeota archaeon]|jgi:tyrosine decarboxylase/aspartate 1-decarboxylase
MFEDHGMSSEEVLRKLDEVLGKDSTYRTGHPIASMSTIPHGLGTEIFIKTLENNAGRMHTFGGSEEIEKEVVGMIAEMLHLEMPYGTTTSGGTESNILALLAARELRKKKTKTPEIVAPRTVHSSVDKAGWLLGMKIVKTRVDKQFKASTGAIEKAITKDTVAILSTAGSTYLGQIDPIDKIGEIAQSHDLPFHVDAAFGAFVIPFLEGLGYGAYPFDFEVEGVTSISADPHKMGLAPIPSGCAIFRVKRHLKLVTSKIDYLRGASSTQSSVLGTRPAAPILATWAIMKHLGRSGYRSVVGECMRRTMMVKDRIENNPLLTLAIQPVMNILGIESKEVSIDMIAERMERRGWRMATSPKPPTIRLVVMPHMTDGSINAFLNDLDEISTTVDST